MKPSFVEVKSALWQKVLMSLVALLFVSVSIICWMSPWVPIFRDDGTPFIQIFVAGLFFFAGGFAIWWPVMRYSIRADEEGIVQTNGFFKQSALWCDVASYYLKPNERFYGERRFHVEPVMFDANGEIVFRGFAHIFVSTRKIIEQRRELWRFVEEQLQEKKVDAPVRIVTPEMMAVKSLEVNWKQKSVLWKVGRAFGLMCYALFWTATTTLPICYMAIDNIKTSKYWIAPIMFVMFIGPLLPYIIYIEIKKRQIAKQLKQQEL